MQEKAPFKLLYNNDGGNVASLVSPWHEENESFREEMLEASIEEVAAFGVDAYLLSPGMGWVPWWQSDVEPGFYDWWRKRTGLEVEGVGGRGYERYVAKGGDMVRILAETCRRYGMAPFVSLRLNDVHHQEHYRRRDQQSLVACRFYTEHPEWHIDPDHPHREGYYKGRGMNWAVPDVRDYKLSLLRELAGKYDLAGLELDFLRDDTLFADDVDEHERIAIVSDFVRRLRAALDERKGPRRWLCVRIPLQFAAHARSGLDVRQLYEAGVDMFNLSGWFHTTQRSDLAVAREQVPDAAIYLEMSQSTGNHRYFLDNPLYGCDGDPRTSDHQFYTTALLAHKRGADGVSLFNFAYYRRGLRTKDVPEMEPPFHVLPKLKDPAFLARQHRYYMLAKTSYYGQLPRKLVPGQTETFELDMLASEGVDASAPPGRLRVHLREPYPDRPSPRVLFNGRALGPTGDVSRFFGNPFDGMIGPDSHRRAWSLPKELIVDGLNYLKVTTDSYPVEIIYIDCAVPR